MRTFQSAGLLYILLIGIIFFGFISDDFFQFTLRDLNNKPVNLETYRKNKATVVIFLLSDCPASESYSSKLNKLAKKYEKDNVKFIGIFPGTYSTDKELLTFQKNYKVTFPLLKDSEMHLVKYLKASIAPMCFVIDNNSKIIYKGRIDDWLYALGKKRSNVTENNLEDALISVVKGTQLKVKETNAIGCILEYE